MHFDYWWMEYKVPWSRQTRSDVASRRTDYIIDSREKNCESKKYEVKSFAYTTMSIRNLGLRISKCHEMKLKATQQLNADSVVSTWMINLIASLFHFILRGNAFEGDFMTTSFPCAWMSYFEWNRKKSSTMCWYWIPKIQWLFSTRIHTYPFKVNIAFVSLFALPDISYIRLRLGMILMTFITIFLPFSRVYGHFHALNGMPSIQFR